MLSQNTEKEFSFINLSHALVPPPAVSCSLVHSLSLSTTLLPTTTIAKEVPNALNRNIKIGNRQALLHLKQGRLVQKG